VEQIVGAGKTGKIMIRSYLPESGEEAVRLRAGDFFMQSNVKASTRCATLRGRARLTAQAF
jgi:hypothetical protein